MQYFLTLTIVFVAMLIGQLVFLAVVYFVQGRMHPQSGLSEVFEYSIPVLCIGLAGASYGVAGWLLQRAKSQTTLSDKLLAYRSVLLVRYALLEVPSLLSTVAYLLTANVLFMGISLAMVVLFVLNRPSAERAAIELALDFQEKTKLDDPQAVVVQVPRY